MTHITIHNFLRTLLSSRANNVCCFAVADYTNLFYTNKNIKILFETVSK